MGLIPTGRIEKVISPYPDMIVLALIFIVMVSVYLIMKGSNENRAKWLLDLFFI